jgi:hypothetical protein
MEDLLRKELTTHSMEDLLRKELTTHYSIPVCTTSNIFIATDETYFEIEDTNTREILLHTTRGNGMANFSNPDKIEVTVTNYDKFVSSLPHHFEHGRKRCDILVSSNNNKCFILGELKDRNISNKSARKNIRGGAKKQLLQSLETLIDVEEILDYINTKSIKRCCYFNKKSESPKIINATTAFNRLPNIFPDGFKMSYPNLEALNFEFWEYTGEQTLTVHS